MPSGTITILPTDIIKPVAQQWEYAKMYEPMFVSIPFKPITPKKTHKKFQLANIHFTKQEVRRIIKVLFHVNNLPLNEYEFRLEYSDNLWAAINQTRSDVKFFVLKDDPIDCRLTVHLFFDTSAFHLNNEERLIRVWLQREKNPATS